MNLQSFLDFAFTNFWHFWGVFAFFALICQIIGFAVDYLFKVWNRFMRMLSIRKHGWPPAHCDADGDPVKTTEK